MGTHTHTLAVTSAFSVSRAEVSRGSPWCAVRCSRVGKPCSTGTVLVVRERAGSRAAPVLQWWWREGPRRATATFSALAFSATVVAVVSFCRATSMG